MGTPGKESMTLGWKHQITCAMNHVVDWIKMGIPLQVYLMYKVNYEKNEIEAGQKLQIIMLCM